MRKRHFSFGQIAQLLVLLPWQCASMNLESGSLVRGTEGRGCVCLPVESKYQQNRELHLKWGVTHKINEDLRMEAAVCCTVYEALPFIFVLFFVTHI